MNDEFLELVETSCLVETLFEIFENYEPSGKPGDVFLIFVPRRKKVFVSELLRDLGNKVPCGTIVLGARESDMRVRQTTWDYMSAAYKFYERAQIIPYEWLT